MSWQITVTNSTTKKLVISPDALTPLGVFSNQSISLEGYAPIRLMGLNDANTTAKPFAIRIKDSVNDYQLGYTGDATFTFTLSSDDTGGHYTVEGGGNASVSKKLYGKGGLAPQEFITDEMKQNMTTLNYYMETVARLVNPTDKDYQEVIDLYNSCKKNSTNWSTKVFPNSIKCASDIVDYALSNRIYIDGIYSAYSVFADQSKPENERKLAKDGMTELLQILVDQAEANYNKADIVLKDITDFGNKLKVNCTDSKNILDKYTALIGPTSTDIQNLQNSIKQKHDDLDDANDKYKKYCIIAATTATYAWIFPAGLIAAGVVAGVYGARAEEERKRAKALSDELTTLNSQLTTKQGIFSDITTNNTSLTKLNGSIVPAVGIIANFKASWNNIRDDIGNIKKDIQNTADATAIKFIFTKNVESLRAQWEALYKETNEYRLHAFVTVISTV